MFISYSLRFFILLPTIGALNAIFIFCFGSFVYYCLIMLFTLKYTLDRLYLEFVDFSYSK